MKLPHSHDLFKPFRDDTILILNFVIHPSYIHSNLKIRYKIRPYNLLYTRYFININPTNEEI